MELSEFNYELPEELIAQTPIEKRDESRLMILDKNTGKIELISELSNNSLLFLIRLNNE